MKWVCCCFGKGSMFPPASNKLSRTIQIHTLCIPFQIRGLLPCGLRGSCELIPVGWLPTGWWCCIFALLQNSFRRPLGYWQFASGNPKHSPNLRSKSLNYSEKKQVRYRCCRSCVLDKGSEKHLRVLWLCDFHGQTTFTYILLVCFYSSPLAFHYMLPELCQNFQTLFLIGPPICCDFNSWAHLTSLGFSFLICLVQGLDEMVSKKLAWVSKSSVVLWHPVFIPSSIFKRRGDMDKVAVFYFPKLWLN